MIQDRIKGNVDSRAEGERVECFQPPVINVASLVGATGYDHHTNR